MIYKAMKILSVSNNRHVIEYGEFGDTFYIILKGKVSVKIPIKISKDFTFKELCSFVCENYHSILKDQKYENALEVIQSFIPEAVRTNRKNDLELNKDVLQGAVSGLIIPKSMKRNFSIFPMFPYKRDPMLAIDIEIDTKIIRRNFDFMILTHVSNLNVGAGFGELALINNVPRSATITTLEDSWFAVLEKSDFKEIIGRIYKNKFSSLIKIMDRVMIFDDLNRGMKE